MPSRKSIENQNSRRQDRQTVDVIFGTHAVLAALANPERHCLTLLATQNAFERHRNTIIGSGIECERTTADHITKRLPDGAVHQGLLLTAHPLPEYTFDVLPKTGIVVALDHVTDPHNVGAVMRSCAAFGACGVIMTRRHGPENTGILAKAASGALELVPVIRVPNLARALRNLKADGWLCIGLDGDGDVIIDQAPFTQMTVIVVGAEGKGLRKLTRDLCDVTARIDINPQIGSLNVSNAAAIALYALRDRHDAKRTD